jgi:hypothetical protein
MDTVRGCLWRNFQKAPWLTYGGLHNTSQPDARLLYLYSYKSARHVLNPSFGHVQSLSKLVSDLSLATGMKERDKWKPREPQYKDIGSISVKHVLRDMIFGETCYENSKSLISPSLCRGYRDIQALKIRAFETI